MIPWAYHGHTHIYIYIYKGRRFLLYAGSLYAVTACCGFFSQPPWCRSAKSWSRWRNKRTGWSRRLGLRLMDFVLQRSTQMFDGLIWHFCSLGWGGPRLHQDLHRDGLGWGGPRLHQDLHRDGEYGYNLPCL